MSIISSIYGHLLDWAGLANVPDLFQFRGAIPAGTDFDSLLETGIHTVTTAIVAECTNCPSANGGILLAFPNKNRAIGGHVYLDNTNKLYTRYRTTSAWSTWDRVGTASELAALQESCAVERHTDGIGPLVEIAETYFNVAYDPDDQLVYQSARGLYAQNMYSDDGQKAIVCSQFVQACIAGIAYQCSRYVGDTNSRRSWGFVSDGSGVYAFTEWDENNDYMISAEQARYFDNLGLLKTFDVNRNALLPGDLLFYSNDEATERYKNIDHVAICLGADKTKYMVMESWPKTRAIDGADVGVVAETKFYSSYAPAYYVRSPIRAEYTSELLASAELTANGTYDTNSQHIKTFSLALERGFYTVHFDDSGDSPHTYVKVYYEDGSAVNYQGVKNGGLCDVVFYAEMPVTAVAVLVANGTTYGCTKAQLYRGYHPQMR